MVDETQVLRSHNELFRSIEWDKGLVKVISLHAGTGVSRGPELNRVRCDFYHGNSTGEADDHQHARDDYEEGVAGRN